MLRAVNDRPRATVPCEGAKGQGIAGTLRQKGITTEAVAIEGSPGDAIVEYAKAHDIELITIATHGRKNIGRLVFGSVAEHVLKHTGIPVLSIKPHEA